MSFRITLSDLERLSEILNATKHRTASLRQLSCLFLPLDALHKRGLCRGKMHVCRCPSVCLSLADIVSKQRNIFSNISPSDGSTISVFPWQTLLQCSDGDLQLVCRSQGVVKNCDFPPISRFISETIQHRAITLWSANGNSCAICRMVLFPMSLSG